MNDAESPDTSEAVMVSRSEEDWAALCRAQGARIVGHRGRFWIESPRGFFRAVHWLSRMTDQEATRPATLCWGYTTSLDAGAAEFANGSMPVHLLSDVAQYDMQYLPSKRRNQLRKCFKLVRLVQVTGPSLLREQGFQIVHSALTRTGYTTIPAKANYLAGLERLIGSGYRLVLAGLIDGKLGGYLVGYAVTRTAYIESVYVATEYLPTDVGTGLVFEFVQACRRSATIDEVVYGMYSREDQKLRFYKERMGFPVTHFPTRIRMNSLIAAWIRRRHPHVYYRLTGT